MNARRPFVAGSSAAAIAATVLVCAGCTLAESEPGVTLSVVTESPFRTAFLNVRVEASVGNHATVIVDGARNGTVPVGALAAVDVSRLPDGEHSIRAEIHDAGRVLRSDTARFVTDRQGPSALSISPPLGPFAGDPPGGDSVTATITFDEPARVVSHFDPSPPSVTSSADRRTLTFAMFGRWLEASVQDDVGNVTELHLHWPRVGLGLTVLEPDLTKQLRGVDKFLARFDLPEVTVGLSFGGPAAQLVSGVASTLDTRRVSDGPSQLLFYAPGRETESRDVWIDNTPPDFVWCSTGRQHPGRDPSWHGRDAAPVGDSMLAWFFDPVTADGGRTFTTVVDISGPIRPASLPATWSGTLPRVTDAAGNEGPTGEPCTAFFPEWRLPAGEGPLAVPADATAVWALDPVDDEESWVDLACLVPGLGAGGGTGLALYAFTPWASSGGRLNSPSGVVESVRCGVRGCALFEREADGAGWMHGATGSFSAPLPMLYLGPEADPVRVEDLAPLAYAWTQSGAGGARELRVFWLPDTFSSPPAAGSALLVTAEPAGTPLAAALSLTRPRIAYVEAVPGRSAWLLERAAKANLVELLAPVGPLNADPAADAASPAAESTAATDLLAWLEGGRVYTRIRASGGTYGPPVPMSDPAATPRAPTFAPTVQGPVLSFVETGPGGDRLVARRFVEAGPGLGAWQDLPTPLDLGTVLPETPAPWPGVLWRDDAGGYLYRRYNE